MVVILNHDDYINKALLILSDEEKFPKLGSVKSFNKTKSMEHNFQNCLLTLAKEESLTADIYEVVRPVGYMDYLKPIRTMKFKKVA